MIESVWDNSVYDAGISTMFCCLILVIYGSCTTHLEILKQLGWCRYLVFCGCTLKPLCQMPCCTIYITPT